MKRLNKKIFEEIIQDTLIYSLMLCVLPFTIALVITLLICRRDNKPINM